MDGRAVLLHAHVVATTQDLAISRDEACSDGHAALAGALLGFFESCLEAYVGGGHVCVMTEGNLDNELNLRSGFQTIDCYLAFLLRETFGESGGPR